MYDVLHEKMLHCKKPIFPILPSINTAGAEVAAFLAKGHVNFADEVTLGTALSRIMNAPRPANNEIELFGVDVPRIRRIIDSIPADGYIAPHYVQALLRSAGIPIVEEFVSDNKEEVLAFARRTGFPVVAKVVGPVHKSDVGGVVLNIKSEQHLALEFDRMMQIPEASAIMVQPMLKGTELFIGAKYEEKFGHVVLCGLGGIFVEVLKDILAAWGDRHLAAARELTKLHEEFYRGTVSGCLEWLETNSPRGEFCLVLGAGDGAFAAAEEELEPLDEVRKLMADGVDKKAALAQVAKKRKIPKRELYNQLISEGDGSDND